MRLAENCGGEVVRRSEWWGQRETSEETLSVVNLGAATQRRPRAAAFAAHGGWAGAGGASSRRG
jgi:hypothetical protein